MKKDIKDRLKEIEFDEIGAKGVATMICGVIVKNKLSLNQAYVTLDLVKDILANIPLDINTYKSE